jgi:uncharacterized protein YecA (UPF0149 family)
LLQNSEDVVAFDQALDEKEQDGRKLSSYKKHARSSFESFITSINTGAKEVIKATASSVNMLNHYFKTLLLDSNEKPHNIIKNWDALSDDLDHLSMGLEAFSAKLDDYVRLMGLLLNDTNFKTAESFSLDNNTAE